MDFKTTQTKSIIFLFLGLDIFLMSGFFCLNSLHIIHPRDNVKYIKWKVHMHSTCTSMIICFQHSNQYLHNNTT